MRRMPAEHERHLLAGAYRETRLAVQVDPLEHDGTVKAQRIRSGDGVQTALGATNPWDVLAVLEAYDQFAAHGYPAFQADR